MANTTQYHVSKAARESLADVIVLLNPYDTFMYNNTGDTTSLQKTHE